MSSITSKIFKAADGDALLILGDIVFGYIEIPDHFNFGGDQMLSVQQLVGGRRVVNSLGPTEHDISWSGMFFGGTATERALALDYLRKKGDIITFNFGTFLYDVIIKSYSAKFERFYQIPYSITLQVVKNNSLPVPVAVPAGYNDAVNTDAQFAVSLGAIINQTDLTSAITSMTNSIANAGKLDAATPDQLNLIRSAIQNAQAINDELQDVETASV